MSEEPFAPISRTTVSSQIRAQLLERVTTGELAPGSPMPSERELSERFGVARTSVREAMQGLVSMGVVERRGNRSHVAEHLPEIVFDPAGEGKSFVSGLFETRLVLEVPLFELATERASAEERAHVAVLAKRFDDLLDLAGFRRLDREFHTTIAACCGNPLLIELYGKVLDRLFRSGEFSALLTAEDNRSEVDRIIEKSSAAHREIADTFVSGDVKAMGEAARRHLREVERSMVYELD